MLRKIKIERKYGREYDQQNQQELMKEKKTPIIYNTNI